MGPFDEFPVELNGKTAEGKLIYVKPDGSACIEVPYTPPPPDANGNVPPRPPRPSGYFFDGTYQDVPTPEHMKDPIFLAHPMEILRTNRDGSKCISYSQYGNPPFPPVEVPCPACAKEFADRFVAAERAENRSASSSVLGRLSRWWKD